MVTLVAVVTCALCGRTILLGEAFQHWRVEGAGTETAVCVLCEDEAEAQGWARVEQPPGRQSSVGPNHVRKVA
jgi:hypothetical protein